MKTIEEKAKEYAAKCHCQNTEWGFIAGAQSEREELTRWRDPNEPPEHTNTVLLKLESETGCNSYITRRFMFGKIWGKPICFGCKVVGWRPIHENE